MPKRTTGKPNAHLRALLFPIPVYIQRALENLSEDDKTVVYQYLFKIRGAALGFFVGRVPLRDDRAPLLDHLADILATTPGTPLFTAARRVAEQYGKSESGGTASLARWLVNEWKKRQARG